MSLRLTEAQAAALGIVVDRSGRAQIKPPAPGAKRSSGVDKRLSTQSPSQDMLARLLRPIYGSRIQENYRGAIPNRRFEIDMALPDIQFGIEVDGWQYHGKYKDSFLRDREKDWLAHLAGWLIVRVAHRRIVKYDPNLLPELQQIISQREALLGHTHDSPHP